MKSWLDKLVEEQEPNVEGQSGYTLQEGPIPNDLFIEWTYTIDLDNNAFIIDSKAAFRLDNIPRGTDNCGWIKYLALDASGCRCLHPETPLEFVATAAVALPIASEVDDSSATEFTQIESSVWNDTKPSIRDHLADLVLDGFIAMNFSALSNADWGDSAHHSIALWCLQMCIPSTHFLNLAKSQMLPRGFELSDPFISCMIHRKWSDDARYPVVKFRDCFVRIHPTLDSKKSLQNAVSQIANAMDIKSNPNCKAILFSVSHVAAIVVSNGRVSYTPAIAWLPSWGRDKATWRSSLRLIRWALSSSSTGKEASPSTSAEEAIVADDSFSKLPNETVFKIMRYCDQQTYDTFRQVSQTFRKEWEAHPRIDAFTIERMDGDIFVATSALDGDTMSFQVIPVHINEEEMETTSKGADACLHAFVYGPARNKNEDAELEGVVNPGTSESILSAAQYGSVAGRSLPFPLMALEHHSYIGWLKGCGDEGRINQLRELAKSRG
jgi:hypothetical protein